MKSLNWTLVCGEARLIILENQDFGLCFRRLAIECPAFALLAISSAYHLGNRALYLSRHPCHMHLLTIRKLIVLGFLITPIVKVICKILISHKWLLFMDLASDLIQVFGWLLHVLYLLVLRTRITVHSRGPWLTLCGWFATFVVDVLNVRTIIISEFNSVSDKHSETKELEQAVTYLHAVLQVLYVCTLIPKGRARETVPRRLVSIAGNERLPLVADSFSESYGAVTGRSPSPAVLGLPGANSNWISRLLLYWVEPLLRKGRHKLLHSAEDLFELPSRLKTSFLDTKFWIVFRDLQLRNVIAAEKRSRRHQNQPNSIRFKPKPVSILRALISTFGVEYFSLGALKLLADGANFIGPLLLNLIVTYIQENSSDTALGYYYVLGLCGASLLSALCNAHYSYLLNNVILKVRASAISTIYRKTLHLDSATMTGFNTGEIVNFMSTDTECITNMVNFHEFWSMPIKIAVCLFLLHQQVGLAYVAGVGFAVLLIPINHCIARAIGRLSTAMMSQKDSRVKVMTEVLYGIHVIKLYSWEDHVWSKIQSFRKAEVNSLKGRKYLDAFCVFFWATTPIAIALLTFSTFILLDNKLTAAKVFTCLALFNMLIIPLNAFPWVIGGLVQGYVSVKRVQKILQVSDSNMTQCYSNIDENNSLALYVRNGHFKWSRRQEDDDSNARPIEDLHYCFELTDINFEIHKGQFVGIVGPVGSGKTSMLLAVMAEMDLTAGEIGSSCVANGFAYVAQDSWIQNATIRQNILFGRTLHLDHYYEVLHACALEDDLKAFPAGDDTLIGDRGITLSGGQKTRIALARAIYQDKEIYIMDDILSTVDVHVGHHIVNNCIHGLLSQKTRILCTHHRKHLMKADNVFVMSNGCITRQGSPSDILDDGEAAFEPRLDLISDNAISNPTPENKLEVPSGLLSLERRISFSEEWERGTVKWKVYRAYCEAVGTTITPLILLTILVMQASRNISDWWLAHWMSGSSNMSSMPSYESPFSRSQQLTTRRDNGHPEREYGLSRITTVTLHDGVIAEGEDDHYYLMVYCILAGINAIISFIRAFSFAYGGISAAVKLHNYLLNSVLKATKKFFDITPVGRVINRFSTDTYVVDDNLPFVLNIFLAQSFIMAGTIVVISYSLPWLLLILVPLAGIYYNIQSYYRHTSRELRRLEAITLSPVYSHFSETVLGLTTIRAFRAEAKFKTENGERLEKSQRTLFALGAAGGWLSLRLQLIGVVVVTGIGIVAMLEHNVKGIDPGLVGLALSYGLSLTASLSAVVQYFIESEKQLVSVERTLQYIDMVEPERWEGFIKPSQNWPSQGVVAFHNVTLRYRENLPCSLNNVSFATKPCERLGIVGRTGAGKSSLFSAIFRLVEVERGGITIDNHVLAYLDLKDLRSKVSVIPQDHFIFSGTFRSNLDPYNKHTDEELFAALCQCHLTEVVERAGGLDAELVERGSSLSMGQRQLLCLARAVLTQAKVLCIDEATANIDHETDTLIQTTIRTAFKESTVMTIAHRLETVFDSDRILVMHNGKVAELDTPQNLLADPNSLFHQLVHRFESS